MSQPQSNDVLSEMPRCPEALPGEISKGIRDIAQSWKVSPVRPKINSHISDQWDELIRSWISDAELPIIIRKGGGCRGEEIIHDSGRRIITADNSPAQWVCHLALTLTVPPRDSVRSLLESDRIPMSMIIKNQDKGKIKYFCTLGRYSINEYGWKLCHKKSVGLNTRKAIANIDLGILEESFRLLMSPSNFFLLPKEWGGLGELPEFIKEM